jgi:hypothetical protein
MHNLYTSSTIIRMAESRRLRRACSVNREEEESLWDFGEKVGKKQRPG